MIEIKKYNYSYERPALATDCVIFGFDHGKLKLLVTQRETNPFQDQWALPGGFVFINETTTECATRILAEKVGLKNVFIEQLYTFSALDRDPRERIVTVAYFALVNTSQFQLVAGRDTIKAEWFELTELPNLAFDHQEIVNLAIQRIKGKVSYQPIGFELLNEKFTLAELQNVYEAILNITIDKRNFRKKLLAMNLLVALEEKETNVARKPGRYYKFDKKEYLKLTKSGFHFDL
jgi:8-oxo-dGTP diphosphatase